MTGRAAVFYSPAALRENQARVELAGSRARWLRCAFCLAAAWATVATVALTLAESKDKPPTEIPIITVKGQPRPVPIAVPDFKNLGDAPDHRDLGAKLAEILRADLRTSGFFAVLDPKTYLVKAQDEGISAATVRFRGWFETGAQLLVKVGLIVTGDRLRLEGHLFEVDSGRELWKPAEVQKGDVGEGRFLTHLIANAIIRTFTGEDGVFTTRIAYSRSMRVGAELAKNLSVIDYDGHGRRAVTQNAAINLFPRWSPGAGSVVFSTTVNSRWEIARFSFAKGSLTTLTSFPGIALGAAPSPDGSRIAVSLSKDGNAEIYLLDRSGRVLRRLTNHWGIDASPTWSPDGSRIAWVSDRSGTPQIFVMKADGSDPRRLTYRGTYNQEPDWSPKGDQIAFTARDERAKFDLFLVDTTDGTKVDRLTQDEGQNEGARWSPDSRQIVFSSTRGGASELYFMLADTRKTRPVQGAGKGAYTPAWSPRRK